MKKNCASSWLFTKMYVSIWLKLIYINCKSALVFSCYPAGTNEETVFILQFKLSIFSPSVKHKNSSVSLFPSSPYTVCWKVLEYPGKRSTYLNEQKSFSEQMALHFPRYGWSVRSPQPETDVVRWAEEVPGINVWRITAAECISVPLSGEISTNHPLTTPRPITARPKSSSPSCRLGV